MSDNGRRFCAKLSAAIFKLLRIRKIETSAYHPSGNGGVERVNHIKALRALVVNERQDDLDLHLPHVEFAYNNSVSAATGSAPIQVLMAGLPRYPVALLDNIYTRGHLSLERDQLECCNLATDRQRRAYELVREQHTITVSRMECQSS